MELVFYELMIIIFTCIGGLSLVAKLSLGKKGVKQRKVTAEEQLTNVHQDTINRLQSELRKQVGRANRYKQLNDGLEDEENDTPQIVGKGQVTFEEIQALVKSNAPKYEKFLSLPFIKDKVMDLTEGMSLIDVVNQLKSIKGITGDTGLESKDSSGNSQNPNFA